jgi:hypothetical protein
MPGWFNFNRPQGTMGGGGFSRLGDAAQAMKPQLPPPQVQGVVREPQMPPLPSQGGGGFISPMVQRGGGGLGGFMGGFQPQGGMPPTPTPFQPQGGMGRASRRASRRVGPQPRQSVNRSQRLRTF